MLTKKKKLSRREIKEDKLVSTYYKAYGYFEENKSRLFMFGGILIALIALIYFYINNRMENNRIAGTQFARVMELYDRGSYLEAIEGREGTNIAGLKNIVDEYGNTDNGELAKIYLANSYNFLGRTDEALKYYEDYSGGNKIYTATAFAGRAGIHSDRGEFEKAGDLYLKASRISEGNPLNAEYMLYAAINYLNAGNTEEAKELLNKIKSDYPASTAFREVDRYLSQIQ